MDSSFALVLGEEVVLNDRTFWRVGTRVGASWAPRPWFEVATAAVYFPIGGRSPCGTWDAKAECEDYPRAYGGGYEPAPRLEGELQTVARILPFRGKVGDWTFWLGMHAGFAGVMQEVEDQRAVTTGPVYGGTLEAGLGQLGVRARVERLQYVEVSYWGDAEEKRVVSVGAEAVLWLR